MGIQKTRKDLMHEIQEIREQLDKCIEQNGISEDPGLVEINTKLDELILQWFKSSKL